MTIGSSQTPVLELRSVSKRFAGVHALTDISFDIKAGEVLCVLGDNGAGKSTLIKILSGVYTPTEGELMLDGAPTRLESPRDAIAAGIATVFQDVGLMPMMNVARNFFLGVEPRKGLGPLPPWGPFKRIDMKRAGAIAIKEIQALGITRVQDGRQLVGTLSGGEKQAMAIGRAMYLGARVLILDEPTSALGVKQSELVLKLIYAARQRGVSVVFVTHNVQHAMAVGDRYVVLIHGQVAADFRRGERERGEILDLMAGGKAMAELAFEIEASRNVPIEDGVPVV